MPPVTKLGRYDLVEHIGSGGMAEIYLAHARGGGRFTKVVVVKTIRPELACDNSFVRMFLREAELSAQLQHPNIVQVFDSGDEDGRFFIAMEYVEGITLRELLSRLAEVGESMPVDVALVIGRDLARGLSFAHALCDPSGAPLGIVHRDVTPSNVMLSIHGETKLVDFGIARAQESDDVTRTGYVPGKAGYLAPEQIDGGSANARSDIFSCGIVLFEMLTGERLFRGETVWQTLASVKTREIPTPSRIRPALSPAIDEVILRALERDPYSRYQDAADIARDLERTRLSRAASANQDDVATLVERLFGEMLRARRRRSAQQPGDGSSIADSAVPPTLLIPATDTTSRVTPSGLTPSATTPSSRIFSTPTPFPRAEAYLRAMPDGLDSYPDYQCKASLYRQFLDTLEDREQLERLPEPLLQLVREPLLPSSWHPEVHLFALALAVSDLYHPTSQDVIDFWYRVNLGTFTSRIYRVMFALASPAMALRGAERRWAMLHRGTTLSVDTSAKPASLAMRYPPHLVNRLLAQAYGTAWRAGGELAGAKDVEVVLQSFTPTEATWTVVWR